MTDSEGLHRSAPTSGSRAPAARPPSRGRVRGSASAVTRFIRVAYGSPASSPAALGPAPGGRLRSLWRRLSTHGWKSPLGLTSITSVVAVLGLVVSSLFCYNILVRRHYDVLARRSDVEVMLQRRNDVTRNLERAITVERAHEVAVFGDVTQKRTPGRAPPAAAAVGAMPLPAGLPGALPIDRLLAIAEQYPLLRLGDNLQSLMQAVVDVEKDLGGARQAFVTATNEYLHEIHTFPSKLFAGIFGFRDVTFFETSGEAGRLVPLRF